MSGSSWDVFVHNLENVKHQEDKNILYYFILKHKIIIMDEIHIEIRSCLKCTIWCKLLEKLYPIHKKIKKEYTMIMN